MPSCAPLEDKYLSLKLHGWLTASDSESENFLTPLKERLNPFDGKKARPCAMTSDPDRTRPNGDLSGPCIIVTEADSRSDDYQETQSDTISRPHAHPLRRSSSDPITGMHNRYHDPTIDSATLQQNLKDKINRAGQAPPRPWRLRNARVADGPFQWADPQDPSPGFKWFPVLSSSHLSSASYVSVELRRKRRKAPLKSSMKHSSQSSGDAPVESATDSSDATERPLEHKPLRRVKTVEFSKCKPQVLRQLPPLKPWSGEPITNTAVESGSSNVERSLGNDRRGVRTRRAPWFPGRVFKSTVADPALTKTDVHVVAIAPSWGVETSRNQGGIDPATPTMQIVESGNSCYEVIWDDVPVESRLRDRRKNSIASLALRTVSSTAPKSLDRVNSKLTEWNWGRGPDLESFAPQIVVFPDDDGRTPVTASTPDDDGYASTSAPPNSHETSGSSSHLQSIPATAQILEPTLRDETEPKTADEPEIDESDDVFEDTVTALVAPDPEALLGSSAGYRGSQKPLENRRLSNMEDCEIRFRGHRDSVTIARSRLVQGRAISSELFELRDAAALARKRMHARNQTKSEEAIAEAKIAKWEPLISLDPAIMTSPLPTPPTIPGTPICIRRRYSWGLKADSSGSVPRSRSPNRGRHVVIED